MPETHDETPPIRLRVLGPVEVVSEHSAFSAQAPDTDGSLEPTPPVSAPGPLASTLLIALALAPGHTLSVDALLDEVWGDRAGGTRASLQTLISRLRAAVGPGLVDTTAGGYTLSCASDLDRARDFLARATQSADDGDPAAVIALASRGLELWRGEAGAGASNLELAAALAAVAGSVEDALLVVRARAAIAQGRGDIAVSDARRLSMGSPFNDEAVELLLRGLQSEGHINEALSAYAEYAALLRDELGSGPTPRLSALHIELLRDEPDDGAAPLGRSSATAPLRIGLRSAANALIGREEDVSRLCRRIETSRLVTIAGPGGMGKTRLGQELAARAVASGQGAVVVELAGVRADDDVPVAIATTLGLYELIATRRAPNEIVPPDFGARIVEVLDEQPTLLVIDNCEQVIDGVAQWVFETLATTTNVRVLTTSRAPLAIAAEHVYRLDALPTREESGNAGPAVTLFETRARAVRPDVRLPDDVVERLCTRLDGMPLAIELAAARTRAMSVEEIERRLEDRFALLTGGDRTAPERHRTLQAVIEWSWDLLTASQRELCSALAIFTDGFTAQAAAYLAPATPDGLYIEDELEALVSQSLLRVEEAGTFGQVRYRMLETVREFGLQRQSEAGTEESVLRAYLAWAHDTSHRIALEMDGREQPAAFAEAAAELDNLLHALRAAGELRDPATVSTIFALLGEWWATRGGFAELAAFGPMVMDVCLDYTPEPIDAENALTTFALLQITEMMAGSLRRAAQARIALRRTMKIDSEIRPSRVMMGQFAMEIGRWSALAPLAEQAKKSGDPLTAALAHMVTSGFAENVGQLETAIEEAKLAFALTEGLGHTWMRAMSAQMLGGLFSQSLQPDKALHWATIAKRDMESLGTEVNTSEVDQLVALSELVAGNYERAARVFESILDPNAQAPEDSVVLARAGLAETKRGLGRTEEALADYRLMSTEQDLLDFTRMTPWVMIVEAGALAAHVIDGAADHPDLPGIAGHLVNLAVKTHEQVPNFTDLPVLGCVCVGLGAWALDRGDASVNGEDIVGMLFALADRFSSRQEMPSLSRDTHWARYVAARSEAGQAEARAVIGQLDDQACLTLAYELFVRAAD